MQDEACTLLPINIPFPGIQIPTFVNMRGRVGVGRRRGRRHHYAPSLLKISATVILNLWDIVAFIAVNVFHTSKQNNLTDWILNVITFYQLLPLQKQMFVVTYNLVLNINKVHTRECDCCELTVNHRDHKCSYTPGALSPALPPSFSS